MTLRRDKLVEYVRLLNTFWPSTAEANAFLQENRGDREFVELAQLAWRLKMYLVPANAPEVQDVPSKSRSHVAATKSQSPKTDSM